MSQDLENKSLVDEILVDRLSTTSPVECMSLAWRRADGQTVCWIHRQSNLVSMCMCVHMCVVCPPRWNG